MEYSASFQLPASDQFNTGPCYPDYDWTPRAKGVQRDGAVAGLEP